MNLKRGFNDITRSETMNLKRGFNYFILDELIKVTNLTIDGTFYDAIILDPLMIVGDGVRL